jgi:hypothetical protein
VQFFEYNCVALLAEAATGPPGVLLANTPMTVIRKRIRQACFIDLFLRIANWTASWGATMLTDFDVRKLTSQF